MVPKRQLMSKTTPRFISTVQRRIGVLQVLELCFFYIHPIDPLEPTILLQRYVDVSLMLAILG